MRFLIVEDDLGSRRLLETIGRRYGECNVAVNGSEAIEAFHLGWKEQHPYDVIFLDIMMPEKDGMEALAEIRSAENDLGVAPGREVKVIMTTALEDPKTVVNAFYHGEASGYLVKPIQPDKVAAELHKLGLV